MLLKRPLPLLLSAMLAAIQRQIPMPVIPMPSSSGKTPSSTFGSDDVTHVAQLAAMPMPAWVSLLHCESGTSGAGLVDQHDRKDEPANEEHHAAERHEHPQPLPGHGWQ